MMKKNQSGQVFILVLLVLTVGALLAAPVLNLTSTSLKSSQIATRRAKALYAADAAQEYVMWTLIYGDKSQFVLDVPTPLFFDCCGIPVDITVIMRAVPGRGGIVLSTDDVIKPDKSVSPSAVPKNSYQTFTYVIRMEQLSTNTTQGLDAVYDIIPKFFGTSNVYVAGSSYLRVDGGSWQSIPGPALQADGGQLRLMWPVGYNWETGAGGFSSDPASPNYFLGIRNFNVRQVKEIKFQVHGTTPNQNGLHGNWVILKPWNSLSGPQAIITVGSPDPNEPLADGLLNVVKTSYPSIVMPGEETVVTYTVNMTNNDDSTHDIIKITDYLPPEFFYTDNSTGGMTTQEPTKTMKTVNGVLRQELVWVPLASEKSIAAGATKTLTFRALTTKNVSGSFYNEVLVESNFSYPIFEHIGVTNQEYETGFSWNSGTVTVPAYDSETNADNMTTIDANLALAGSSVTITSYTVR